MNNLRNKKDCLQSESFEVVVIKDPNMRPFLNVFQADGRNIQQQKLGKIFGIIQIDDNSENSAYLPNLLTQILKKEYFKNKNKNCGKSFEIALHKLNLALTELAQHEIVKWINNLNAVIGVVCDNEIHFTQIGKGRLLFLKNGKITAIGNEGNGTEEYHPMKTFSTISAGKLEKDNKLIFTIQKTFRTLREDELERHYKTFNSDEFDNIVSSTLRNEASNTGMVVVNIKSQEENAIEEIPVAEPKAEDDINFFGEEKGDKKVQKKKNEKKIKKEEPIKEVPKEEDPNKSPFENEPEIFLKEDDSSNKKTVDTNESEKIALAKETYQQSLEKIKDFFKDKKSPIKKISFNKVHIEKITNKVTDKINKDKITSLKNFTLKKFRESKDWTIQQFKKIDTKKINLFFQSNFEKASKTIKSLVKKIPISKERFLSLLKKKKTQKLIGKIGIETNIIEEKKNEKLKVVKSTSNAEDFFKKSETIPIQKEKSTTFLNEAKHALNNTTKKIKEGWDKSANKKIIWISLAVITTILITTIFFSLAKNKPKISKEPMISYQPQGKSPEQNDPEIKNLTKLASINNEVKDTAFFRNDLFLLTTDNHLINFSIRDNTKTDISLPKELKNPQHLTSMESLQLIFITSPDKVYSYSPVTENFSENKIDIPNNSSLIGTGTYLSYIYLIDKNSDQIYRYHRAPGGFGESKNWLRESYDLENATSFDVSDSIYITFNDGRIEKYFENKKTRDFKTEEGFIPNKIRVKADYNEVFALDKEQGKIIKLSENGTQETSFTDNQFKNAYCFSVDFENKKIFVITDKKEILMFDY